MHHLPGTPHKKCQIDRLESIQRQAARFVSNNFDFTSSVSDFILDLDWDTLAERRRINRLKNFYATYYSLGGWAELHSHLQESTYLGRNDHKFKTRCNAPRTNYGQGRRLRG